MSFLRRGKTLVSATVVGIILPGFFLAQAASVSTPSPLHSSTHPDQTRWYKNANPVFMWDLPADTNQVRLVLSKYSGTTPRVIYNPPITQKALTSVPDGIWYLSAQFDTLHGTSPIYSYQFNIDTQPPLPVTLSQVTFSDAGPQIMFGSTDALSGIANYEVRIDFASPILVASTSANQPYFLPIQKPGLHRVSVAAFDKAGNTATATVSFITKSSPTPSPTVPPHFLSSDERGDNGHLHWWWLAALVAILAGISVAMRHRRQEQEVLVPAGSKLDEILDDIKKEIALLGKISKHRPLYPEERYLRSKLGQYQKVLQSLVKDTHKKLAKRK